MFDDRAYCSGGVSSAVSSAGAVDADVDDSISRAAAGEASPAAGAGGGMHSPPSSSGSPTDASAASDGPRTRKSGSKLTSSLARVLPGKSRRQKEAKQKSAAEGSGRVVDDDPEIARDGMGLSERDREAAPGPA